MAENQIDLKFVADTSQLDKLVRATKTAENQIKRLQKMRGAGVALLESQIDTGSQSFPPSVCQLVGRQVKAGDLIPAPGQFDGQQ